jgi:hypothetical protein
MSRPFSYNDENFTVIGNVVFIHCEISTNAYSVGDTLCIIPPAIYDRLIYYNLMGFVSTCDHSQGGSYRSRGLYIDKDRNLKLDDTLNPTFVQTRFITGFLIIKDI